MSDRTHVETAADAGARKSVCSSSPQVFNLLRSVGAGMGLTLVVFM